MDFLDAEMQDKVLYLLSCLIFLESIHTTQWLRVYCFLQVQDEACKTGSEIDALLAEFNSMCNYEMCFNCEGEFQRLPRLLTLCFIGVTEDLIVLTSDDGAESDTASEATVF